jgi:hypothetical protein
MLHFTFFNTEDAILKTLLASTENPYFSDASISLFIYYPQ